MTKYGVIFHYD